MRTLPRWMVPTRAAAVYSATVAAAIIVLAVITAAGTALDPPAATAVRAVSSRGASNDTLLRALLALTVIIATTRVLAAALRSAGQAAVIGELLGGLMLGPSLLGWLWPGLHARLLPADVAAFLAIYAQLGVVLYLFLVGLELDLALVRRHSSAMLAVSHASIVLPLVLGAALALALYPLFATADTPFVVFALFIGVSMSVTAFPVLSRILTDHGLSRSRMGAIALGCAAIDDISAWCLLALVIAIARARPLDAVVTVALAVGFVMVAVQLVAPLLKRWLAPASTTTLPRSTLAAILLGVLVAGAATEWIGIHAFFGAFVFGMIIPSDSAAAEALTRQLTHVVAILFLPVFFAYTGMRTDIGLVAGAANWLWCGAIIATACIGKFGGTIAASRLTGHSWRDSAALGILMNTRGLVELVVLNIGLDMGVISPQLFTMLVVMALVTTVMTSPILRRLLRKQSWVEMPGTPTLSPGPLAAVSQPVSG